MTEDIGWTLMSIVNPQTESPGSPSVSEFRQRQLHFSGEDILSQSVVLDPLTDKEDWVKVEAI